MNIILLTRNDFINDEEAIVTGRRFLHIRDILKVSIGDFLSVGVLEEDLGVGIVVDILSDKIVLRINLRERAPNPITCNVILALPRPIVLNRILISLTSLGVKTIYLLHTKRVEKSYWQSPLLKEKRIKESLKLGLEQSKDTILPDVFIKKSFKEFIKNLPVLLEGAKGVIADPVFTNSLERSNDNRLLAIGPEGGFMDYELESFQRCGFKGVSLGQRILKVETALTVLIAKSSL